MNIDNGYDIVITKTGATGEALENLPRQHGKHIYKFAD